MDSYTDSKASSDKITPDKFFHSEFFKPTVRLILEAQRPSGEIPWFKGGPTDPWDHIEAAMGLSIYGEHEAAERAYLWLKHTQLRDGSWWSSYFDGKKANNAYRDTNFTSYIATGVWHHFLVANDIVFLIVMWTVIDRAIEFVLNQQAPAGDIKWAVDQTGQPLKEGLLVGCSSIYKSLQCATKIAATLGYLRPHWQMARRRLGDALRFKTELFNADPKSQKAFSMYWFYPVLTGVIESPQAAKHLSKQWHQYVVEDMGCRCTTADPWVTVAESCELTMALLAAGEFQKAAELFSWLHQWRADDGVYWTGYELETRRVWPEEKNTWTSGSVLLAADALANHTAAAHLFSSI